ncbi:MAG: phage tail family protein [Spirochaetales bacterium]|nr:phage tail family protein [Spirochaetales bacterium]
MGHVMRYVGDKMIYGLDFYVSSIDDNETKFWLQYKNDNRRLIVDFFDEIDLGLPKESHSMTENSFGINSFYGRAEYGTRTITLQTHWAKDTDGGIISRRRNFLIDFFTGKTEKLYFYMYIPQKMRRFRVEVKPSITGEKYKNFVIAENISITLTCASVYFESETYSQTVMRVNSDAETPLIVNNEGYETSFVLQIIPDEDFSEFQLSNSAGGAFRIITPGGWTAGSVIEVDTGTTSITVDGVEQRFGLNRGTYFSLMQGENTLYFQGGKSQIKILYREKVK